MCNKNIPHNYIGIRTVIKGSKPTSVVEDKLDSYFTLGQVAAFVGVTKTTIIRWEEQKRISSYRNPLNNFRLYRKEEVERLVAEMHAQKEGL